MSFPTAALYTNSASSLPSALESHADDNVVLDLAQLLGTIEDAADQGSYRVQLSWAPCLSSKFRNIEASPRAGYEQLPAAADAGPAAQAQPQLLAASRALLAFAHQLDAGGAVRVKPLSATGREPATPPLVRAHASRVSALAFLPLGADGDADLLATAGADDALVKLWRLPARDLDADLLQPAAAIAVGGGGRSPIAGIRPHPSAAGVVAAFDRDRLSVLDVDAERVAFAVDGNGAALVSAACWNFDGSVALVAASAPAAGAFVSVVDPRVAAALAPADSAAVAHENGHRPVSAAWCGALGHFVTTGANRVQERELKLWDARRLDRAVHRERLLDAAGVGALLPLYDPDTHLLFVLGRGERTVRCFEVDIARAPFVHALDRSTLLNATLSATLVPKTALNTRECEVARVLSLSATTIGGTCDVLSYRVPRKDAVREFQRDLYPDTQADKAALTSTDWMSGQNALPLLVPVNASDGVASTSCSSSQTDTAASSVFGRPNGVWEAETSTWGSPAAAPSPPVATNAPAPAAPPAAPTGNEWSASGWNAPMAPSTQPNTSATPARGANDGWRSGGAKWNEAPVAAPAVVHSGPTPIKWITPPSEAPTPSSEESATSDDLTELSAKAQRLGARYGHKLKYIRGTTADRGTVFNLGDKRLERAASLPVIAANGSYWAAPISGPGGPVLVQPLEASGRASTSPTATSVLNAQRAEVTTLAFSPFDASLLATGSADDTVQLWSVRRSNSTSIDGDNIAGDALASLVSTTASHGVRTLTFHPTAANVLLTTGGDRSLRFWDVEVGQERSCITEKMDDAAWNAAFSVDGALVATAGRDRVVRVFDPRAVAMSAMACGFEGARPQYVTWLNQPHELLTVGASARGDTQLSMWDARKLFEPLAAPTTVTGVDPTSGTTCYPLYDASSHLLLLAGVGSRHVWSFELHPETATAHANLPFALPDTSVAIAGAALLPKSMCDVSSVELSRLLVLTPASVQQVSFSLPRAEKLSEFFQDDVFAPARREHEPLMTSDEWFAGKEVPPLIYDSLRPDGMTPLSEKPVEPVGGYRPKTLEFQAQLRREEEEARAKAERFERLNALAAQPSLHQLPQPNGAATAIVDDDSDDDWDD